jgi:hypothetical protein
MTKHQAIIKLATKPMKIIKWFTESFDKEIGALGIGEMRDGELCVDKLVFPTQTVNGAHVHFKPSDWGPILQELTNEEISKIIFYWHKHPGSASASQGDEEDTFDVFMDENSERTFFGFLQTAKRPNGTFEYEGRIEMRDPIWASITDVKLITEEDEEIEEECQKIIEERITIGNLSAKDQPGMQKTTNSTYEYEKFSKEDKYDAFMEVKKKNGNVIINASIYFEELILGELEHPEITDLFKSHNSIYVKDNMVTIIIKPKKKQINKIYDFFQEYADEMFYIEEDEEVTKDLSPKYEHLQSNVQIDATTMEELDEMFEKYNKNNHPKHKHTYGGYINGWYN